MSADGARSAGEIERFEDVLLERPRRGFARAAALPGNPLAVGWQERDGLVAFQVGAAPDIAWFHGVVGVRASNLPAFDEILTWFEARELMPRVEVSPSRLDDALAMALTRRGFSRTGERAMLWRPLAPADADPATANAAPASATGAAPAAGPLQVRELGAHDNVAHYLAILASGYGFDHPVQIAFAAFEHGGPHVRRFIALEGETVIAAGSLLEHRGVALLAGASTLPDARGRGAQRALIDARLRAAAVTCNAAVVTTALDSGSQRNLERAGFRLAEVTQLWSRAGTAGVSSESPAP